ncbi:MAG: WXG100 family type VII secretion target [Pseudonocardia sp.]
MSQFTTTTEEMAQAARHVRAVDEAVQGDLATLRGQLAPLAGAWQGAAATEFTRLMARWDTSAAQLNQALRDIGESIDGSARNYQAQEDAQASSMSTITAVLG